MIRLTPNDPDFYAEIYEFACIYDGPNAKENAALIDAAPDLLDALECILDPNVNINEAISKAKAAISKARGLECD